MRSYRAQIKNKSLTINLAPMRINLWLSISLFFNTHVETVANGLLSKNANLKNLVVGKPSKGSKGTSAAPFMRRMPASHRRTNACLLTLLAANADRRGQGHSSTSIDKNFGATR